MTECIIRTFRAGDVGMIGARQSVLYLESHGWGRALEINVMQTALDFLRGFKPGREQCWVAERDGVMAGAVLVTDEGEARARLRLLYVEPWARGAGVGSALVDRCVSFAQACRFVELTLWTHTVLASARRIYAAAGFELVETAMHTEFGVPVQGETWRLTLS